jgi:hypothetical protein
MKTAFFTICESNIKLNRNNSRNIDYAGFINSFNRFHEGIPMINFDERDLKKHGVNWYNAKAHFGEMLSKEYDLVVNVDADHYFFGRCEEILKGDYHLACPANYNVTDNLVGINVCSGINGGSEPRELVSNMEFLQGGLIASTSKHFWQHYKFAVDQYYDRFVCLENDVLNLVAYTFPYVLKVLDGDYDFKSMYHREWYGCGLIGKEKDCYIEGGKIMCEGKPVIAYHFAHGGAKRNYDQIFNAEVSEFIKTKIIVP